MELSAISENKPKRSKAERLRSAFFFLFWLVVWEVADRLVDNHLILSGPIRVLEALFQQVRQQNFWVTCGTSFGRIVTGFLLSFVGGVILGVVAHHFRFFKDLLAPIIGLLKTVPMISFVIMLLIWVGNQALTIYLSFLIVLPMVYTSTLSGLEAVDPQLLEMAKVYKIHPLKKLLYIYRPALLPYLLSTSKVALGMSWKSGVMAEVIATPEPSIGRAMYQAKQFLMTADLFAWTIVVILLSFVFERVFLFLLKQAERPLGGRLHHGH